MEGQGTSNHMVAAKLTRKKLAARLRAGFPEMFNVKSGCALKRSGMAAAGCGGVSTGTVGIILPSAQAIEK